MYELGISMRDDDGKTQLFLCPIYKTCPYQNCNGKYNSTELGGEYVLCKTKGLVEKKGLINKKLEDSFKVQEISGLCTTLIK